MAPTDSVSLAAAPGPHINTGHTELLASSAIPASFASSVGVWSAAVPADLPPELALWESALPGLVFTWRGPDGVTHHQLRPDNPPTHTGDDRPRKYLQGNNIRLLNVLGEAATAESVLIVEGTKQHLAAAAYAPTNTLVIGIPGCASAMKDGRLLDGLADLVEDKPVTVVFDADLATNANVWAAADALKEALDSEGASKVTFAKIPGGKTLGLDDYLGWKPEPKRAKALARLISKGEHKLPAQPRSGAALDAGRPAIEVSQDRFTLISSIVEVLRSQWDADRLFSHGTVISERTGDSMRPVDRETLLKLISEGAFTYRSSKNGDVPAWPDNNTISAVAGSADKLSPLRRVVTVPFVRADGTICQTPGYDPASQTFLVADDEADFEPVPEAPTPEQITAACDLLLVEWLGDFPLKTDADKANVLALVITPFIRGLVPLVPLAVINGLQMGVGKNLVADSLALLVTGRNAEPLPFPGDDDERRKLITSAFRTNATLFVFDEAHELGGPSLARAITSVTYKDRILGHSTMAEYPNEVTWVALGNQVQLTGDIVRRVYPITLWPEQRSPESRDTQDFRHTDLRAFTREHRWQLVGAVLTLVSAWFAVGQPVAPKGVNFGSFESWDRIVGGILHVAGIEGFLTNTSDWKVESDYDTAYWTEHLAALRMAFDSERFTVGEVAELVSRRAGADIDFPMPPGLESAGGTGFPRKLGRAYGRMKDRWFGNYRLVKAGVRGDGGGAGGVNQWRVDRFGEHPAMPGAPAAPVSSVSTVSTVLAPEGKVAPIMEGIPAFGIPIGAQHSGVSTSATSEIETFYPSVAVKVAAAPSPAIDVLTELTELTRVAPQCASGEFGPEVQLTAGAVAQAMTHRGVRADVTAAEKRLTLIQEGKREGMAKLRELGFSIPEDGPPGHPWMTNEGKVRLSALVGTSHWPRNAAGEPKLDDATLKAQCEYSPRIGRPDLAKAILQVCQPDSFLAGVAEGADRGRTYPQYSLNTTTARWTSKSPSIHSATKRTQKQWECDRDLILADEGEVLLSVDYTALDARVVAGLSGDDNYSEVLLSGADIHTENARRFLGDANLRDQAKEITHGLNYGQGAKSLAARTGLDRAIVDSMLNDYRRAFPKLADWQNQTRSTAEATGFVSTGTGRLIAVDLEHPYTQAPARAAQGAAADLAAMGLQVLVDSHLIHRLRLFVHDEFILTVPEPWATSNAVKVAELVSIDWLSPSGLKIPITAVASPRRSKRWSDI